MEEDETWLVKAREMTMRWRRQMGWIDRGGCDDMNTALIWDAMKSGNGTGGERKLGTRGVDRPD